MPYPDPRLLPLGLDASSLHYEKHASRLATDGDYVLLARDAQRSIVLAARYDAARRAWDWHEPTLRDYGVILGIEFGVAFSQADPWENPKWRQRVGEFNSFAPVKATIIQANDQIQDKKDRRWANLLAQFVANGQAMRLYNLFYPLDHKDNPGDPLWQGAPPEGKPSAASSAYVKMVGDAMDAKIAMILRDNPNLTELGFANEAIWEFQGSTGWEDGPYYRAFGEDWITEAYVRTFRIASKMGRDPGKKLKLFYGDYGYELPGNKADFFFKVLSKTKTDAFARLRAEGFTVPDDAFIVDMQAQVEFADQKPVGNPRAQDYTVDGFRRNLERFGQIGPVWIAEFRIVNGTPQQRTDIVKLFMQAIAESKTVRSWTFWSLMTQGSSNLYNKGDLFFDPGTLSPTPTLKALEAMLQGLVPSP